MVWSIRVSLQRPAEAEPVQGVVKLKLKAQAPAPAAQADNDDIPF
jgi:hypothetical protein